MKTITRMVKMHSYVFANIDITSGKAHNMTTITRPTPMGSREISAYCKEHNDAVKISHTESDEKFQLPLDVFVNACRSYAAMVAAGQAEPIPDNAEDENSDDSDDEID